MRWLWNQSIDITVKLEDIRRSLTPCLTDEKVGEVLEDAIVTVGVCLCQITSGHVLAKSEMIALLMVCLYNGYQVAQTLAITQLTEHQCKELVPTCEVFHITVSIILVNDVTELVKVQEFYQLREYIFRFVHMQSVF